MPRRDVQLIYKLEGVQHTCNRPFAHKVKHVNCSLNWTWRHFRSPTGCSPRAFMYGVQWQMKLFCNLRKSILLPYIIIIRVQWKSLCSVCEWKNEVDRLLFERELPAWSMPGDTYVVYENSRAKGPGVSFTVFQLTQRVEKCCYMFSKLSRRK